MGSPAPDEHRVEDDTRPIPVPQGPGPAPVPHQHASLGERFRHRLEHINEWIEATGISLHGVNFGLVWWKKAGLRWTVAAFLAVGLPASGYSTLLYSAARAVPDWIGDFGVEFEAEDWDYHLLSMNAVARNVKLRRNARSEPVFTAAEVEFDGSVWSFLRGLFSPGAYYNEITIRKGEVHVERSLVGSVNWLEFLDAVPARRRDAAMAGLYQIEAVYLEDVRLVYVEHTPGQSGSGVIQTAQATVYVEGITGEIFDLVPPSEAHARPTRFKFDGRSATGIVQISGSAGLFSPGGATHGAPPSQNASMAQVPVSTNGTNGTTGAGSTNGTGGTNGAAGATGTATLAGPYYDMNIYLGRVGMAAIAQMVPTTRLVSTQGTLQGTIGIDRSQTAFTCTAELQLEDVGFAPNPRPGMTPTQVSALQQDLIGFRVSDTITPCRSQSATSRASLTTGGASTNSISALVAELNAQATRNAPPSVRVFAALDQQDFAGVVVDASLNELTRQVARRLGLPMPPAIDPLTGQLVAVPSANAPAAGNPVSRGLRSLGGGIKRLFGGGDNRNNNSKGGTSKSGGSTKKPGGGGGPD
jgi:hypothetical protein